MYNGLNKYIHCTSKKTQFQQQIISMSAILKIRETLE